MNGQLVAMSGLLAVVSGSAQKLAFAANPLEFTTMPQQSCWDESANQGKTGRGAGI